MLNLRSAHINALREIGGEAAEAVLALVFAEGMRPDADAVAALVSAAAASQPASGPSFIISHRPDPGEGWVELLTNGLTFDCRGLEPAVSAQMPLAGTLIGLGQQPAGECITLAPGPHLTAGKGFVPIVRVLAGLGVRLAALPGVQAVVWQPARSWMAPDYFIKLMADWQAGGAFPALGLTTLQSEANGAMVSRGLELLIGQELRIEAGHNLTPAEVARIAVRLIHQLVNDGALAEAGEFTGPAGERIVAVPVRNAKQLRVMVQS